MKQKALITSGKLLSFAIKKLNLGNGSTWPGHLALSANKHFIKDILANSQTKIVFIVGTNGKTTTTSILRHILTTDQKKVIQNISGANLLNGLASTLLLNASTNGQMNADIALFEIDENVLPLASREIKPDMIIMLNLFRDQLDRYGEVNSIATKWQKNLSQLPAKTVLVLNADDPQIAYLGKDSLQKVFYFGLPNDTPGTTVHEHAADSLYCPNCGKKLIFSKVFYSHLGLWACSNCSFKRPKTVADSSPSYPLEGTYNKANVHAASLAASLLGVDEKVITSALHTFTPAFGRQETLSIKGKKATIILVKNPTGFNEALRTVNKLHARHLMLVLNDRVADGRDVSWIWDVDFEMIKNFSEIPVILSGDRALDLSVRMKYSNVESIVASTIEEGLRLAFSSLPKGDTLYILPTYTAMLDVRKILTGKKIL